MDVRYSASNRSTDVKHIAERRCVRVRIFLIPYSLAQNQNIPYSCPLKGLYSLFLILMWGPNRDLRKKGLELVLCRKGGSASGSDNDHDNEDLGLLWLRLPLFVFPLFDLFPPFIPEFCK